MKEILVFLALVTPSVSMAHGTKVELVDEATTVALEMFAEQESEDINEAFNAVKTWVSGAKIKVKAYYNSSADNFLYECVMDHSNGKEEMVCVKQ